MELSHSHNHWKQAPEQSSERVPATALPDRYSIRRRGEDRELVCRESPNVVVRVERGLTVSAGNARKAPPGTIYLDGAAEGGPFLDVEKAVFNLNHHEDCVRPFTLATCCRRIPIPIPCAKSTHSSRRRSRVHTSGST